MSSTTPAISPPSATLHPRNRHQGHYDFEHLTACSPALARFIIANPYGNPSINFADPAAVRALNSALLASFYGIANWRFPKNYLCPPIPGRADYLHYLADLLAEENQGLIPVGPAIRALDIGTGASLIYPLIGQAEYGWTFVGTDIDAKALESAQDIINANPALAEPISLRLQGSRQHLFKDVLRAGERYDFTLCNPPFHASLEQALSGSQRKWRGLGKNTAKHQRPLLNFGGQSDELWCEGGEAQFILRMIKESTYVSAQVRWFSTLVSKESNLPAIYKGLQQARVIDARTVDMAQGQKISRFVAWTFQGRAARQNWGKANDPGTV